MQTQIATPADGEAAVKAAELQKSFNEAVRPLIKWLNDNCHPHHTIIVTPTDAELLEGRASTGHVFDFIKD